jgi:hypothetical protein
MEHRHLDTQTWSVAAIESALERGDLQDWRELFAAVRRDPELGALVLRAASTRKLEGSSVLARALVARLASGRDGLSGSSNAPTASTPSEKKGGWWFSGSPPIHRR